jgi:hypothetical protein
VIIVAYKRVASSLVKLLVSASEVYNVSSGIVVPKSSLLVMKIDPSESISFETIIKSVVNLSIPASEVYNVSSEIVAPKSSLLIVKVASSESTTCTATSAYPSSVALSVVVPLEATVVSDRVFEALANLKLESLEEATYTPPPPPRSATVVLKAVVGEAQVAGPPISLCGTFGVCVDTQYYYSGYVIPPYNYVQVLPFYTMGVIDTPTSGSTPYSELAIDYLTAKDYA